MSLTRNLLCASRTAALLHGGRNFATALPPPSPLSLLSHNTPSASGLLQGLLCATAIPRCRMSTSAPHEQEQGSTVDSKGDSGTVNAANQNDKAAAAEAESSQQTVDSKGDNGNVDAANQTDKAADADAESSDQTRQTGSDSESRNTDKSGRRRSRGTKRTAFSDSDSEVDVDDLSKEELVKILFEKEETLQKKEKEFGEWKDKFLRSYAEMENIMERTKRDAENSKKFAVQSFAKSLLDVADNLNRAASVTKESFKKIDQAGDTVGVVPLLNSLLEGVEMTEKQLAEVFKKAGIEKYDPTNEQFDPNRHNAVFQVPDNSKPPDTVAVVLKAGYTLHDRIIRPAEVGVTVAQGSD